jgi:hypothetical protein
MVHHAPDALQIHLRGGMRVEQHGVVDVLALAGQRRFHREGLDVEVCVDQGRQRE